MKNGKEKSNSIFSSRENSHKKNRKRVIPYKLFPT